MDTLKGYKFIAKGIRPKPTALLAASGLSVGLVTAKVEGHRRQLRALESMESTTTEVPFRKLIAGFGLLEIMLGFILFILQTVSNGQTSYKSHERSFVRYIEFALFGSATTALAGSTAFVVSRQHMRTQNRYHLFIFTFVLTVWSFINDFLLALLHCGLIAVPIGNSSVPETLNATVATPARSDNWSTSLTGPPKDTPESIVQAQALKKALLITFFIAVVFLAASSVMVGHNLIVGFRQYRQRARETRSPRREVPRVGSIESNMNAMLQEHRRRDSIDCQTIPVKGFKNPVLASMDS